MRFQKATKRSARLRLALIGPAGSGKTYSALAIATRLVPNARVAVIDTERGSASKYADQFAFDVLELERHGPTDYVQAIRAAEQEGYDVVVIDSLSHAWSGKGGALELVDQAAKRARTPNSFGAWREVTPLHNEMVDSIVGCKAHVIVTMRAKTEWVQEQDERGKTRIRKVGLAPVQRDGLEYEFDVVGDLDQDHSLLVTKTRCSMLANALVPHPGEALAQALRTWLQGSEPEGQTGAAPIPAPAPEQPAQVPEQSDRRQEAAPISASQNAPTLTSVLEQIEDCMTEAELLQAGAEARLLPAQYVPIARREYAAKLKRIKAAAEYKRKILAGLRDSLTKNQQVTIDALGNRGVILDNDEAIDRLTDKQVEIVETVLASLHEPETP